MVYPGMISEQELAQKLQPVCLGGDILGYSYVRSFHERYGVNPIILSGVNVQVTSASRFCDYRILEDMGSEDVLVGALRELGDELASQGKVGLVLGSADWHARLLAHHKDELSQWYYVPYVDASLMDEICQKDRFYAICEDLGIAYPKTWTVSVAEAQALDPAALPFPLIVKPAHSASYDQLVFEGKEKVYTVEDPGQLTRVLGILAASPYEGHLVLQDYVPGGDDAIRSLTVFANAQGQARVISGGRVVLQDHSPILIGNPCCILSERVPQVIEDATRFLAHVGYHGMANFDIKYDQRDGSYKFFEVNTRPGRNSYYMTLGGACFVEPIVQDFVLGQEVPYREAFDPFLYTVIPPSVVSHHVANEALREEALACFKKGIAGYPYDYKPDTLKHKLLAHLLLLNQNRKFDRYLGKDGKA